MAADETALTRPAAGPRPLSAMLRGEARIVRIDADAADAARLMALGVCVGRRIELVKPGDPLIVRVVGARVGLSARLAATVTVEPADAAGASGSPSAA